MNKETLAMFKQVGALLWLYGCSSAIDQWSKPCGFCGNCEARKSFKEIEIKYKQLENACLEQALKETENADSS